MDNVQQRIATIVRLFAGALRRIQFCDGRHFALCGYPADHRWDESPSLTGKTRRSIKKMTVYLISVGSLAEFRRFVARPDRMGVRGGTFV
jgi:hypothetical protein